MHNVNEVFVAWLPFFTTLTVAGATLAGLLFVALSLHVSALRREENVNLRHLAQHTFGNFVSVLFVGLFFIVPAAGTVFYGITAIVTVTFGLSYMINRFFSVLRERDNPLYRRYYLRHTLWSFVAYLLILLGGIGLLLVHDAQSVYYAVLMVFIGAAMMLMWAMRNSWYLLAHELG